MPGNGHGGFGERQRGKDPVPRALAALPTLPDLTGRQRTTLAGIAKTNARLYRAYLLKEQLRMVFAAKGQPGRVLLAGWIAWARRCRIPEFVKLAATITTFLPLITNTLVHGMSNARSEATNTHLRTLTTGRTDSTPPKP